MGSDYRYAVAGHNFFTLLVDFCGITGTAFLENNTVSGRWN